MKMPDDVRKYFELTGRMGAQKRNANLTPERRQEIARKAAKTRWRKTEKSQPKPGSPRKGGSGGKS